MTICRTRFTLADSTRSSRHPYSRLLDFPTSWHLYTRGTLYTVTSHGFHGESLDCRHGTILLWTTPVDYSLGPHFGDPNRARGVNVEPMWVRSDSCIPEWTKFGTTVPFQTPVTMTQGKGCVPWTVGRMTTSLPTVTCWASCYPFKFGILQSLVFGFWFWFK